MGDNLSVVTQCFALCVDNLDCPNTDCTYRTLVKVADVPPITAKVCDPPYNSCATNCGNPMTGEGCPLPGQTMYLISYDRGTKDDRTVCEDLLGSGTRNYKCSNSRDCAPGWFCLETGECHQVCKIDVPNSCLNGTACLKYGNQYGYCQ
jgi:hypothetical protein